MATQGPSRRQFIGGSAATIGGIAAATMFSGEGAQAATGASATAKRTGTIKDVKHVVILMQENRSFDHYFGSMKGVRGFGDPRPSNLPNGKPVWHQPNNGGELLPSHP